jgi:hypothetical protein
MKIKVNETAGFPAFPFVYHDGTETQVFTGLTVRQYFAAAALQGLLSSKALNLEDEEVSWVIEDAARVAVEAADAIIQRFGKDG